MDANKTFQMIEKAFVESWAEYATELDQEGRRDRAKKKRSV